MSELQNCPKARASRSRKYGTIELFEQYWVDGQSVNDIGTGTSLLQQRGIPPRSREDGRRVASKEVRPEELWDEYLTTFQIKIAQELMYLKHVEDQSPVYENGENQ